MSASSEFAKIFAAAWAAGQPLSIDEMLDQVPVGHRRALFKELLQIDKVNRLRCGTPVAARELRLRFPDYKSEIEECFNLKSGDSIGWATETLIQIQPPQLTPKIAPSSRLTTGQSVIDVIRQHNLVQPDVLNALIETGATSESADAILHRLVDAQALTPWQSQRISKGRGGSLNVADFVLLEELGTGGMSVVYKAIDRNSSETVAVKMLQDRLLGDPVLKRRFVREMKTLGKLSHPSVVKILRYGEDRGEFYYVMEYITGTNLQKKVRESGHLEIHETIPVALQISQAISEAHRHGIIHRDLKPSNVMIDQNQSVIVIDFGLVRLRQTGSLSANMSSMGFSLTKSGMVLGSVDYMSPEQTIDSHRIDERSDIYGLGCTIYFCLTGRPPFHSGSLDDKMDAHRNSPVPSLPSRLGGLRPEMSAFLQKLLAKDPDERPHSMDEVTAHLMILWRKSIQKDSVIAVHAPDSGIRSPHRRSADAQNDQTVLRVVGTDYAYQFPKDQEKIIVGRENSDRRPDLIVQEDVSQDARNRVSRNHLTIKKSRRGLIITDHSRTGTFLNDQRLAKGSKERALVGDRIRLVDLLELEVARIPCLEIELDDAAHASCRRSISLGTSRLQLTAETGQFVLMSSSTPSVDANQMPRSRPT